MFFSLKIYLITDVESVFLNADNALSLFLDKLVNETTVSPPGKPSEEYPKEHSEKSLQSIKVTTL